MSSVVKSHLQQQFLESSLPVGSPFVRCYKYYVETLAGLRLTDLESKFTKLQAAKLEQLFATADTKKDLSSLLHFSDQAFRKDAVRLA